MTDRVWREGNRIRRADGQGYGDMATPDVIWGHIANAVKERDRDFIGFAIAVLDLRATEADEAAARRLAQSEGEPMTGTGESS